MFCTPEQRQIGRWIENHYDIDKVQCAEIVTKNAVRLTLRGHEPTILILARMGGWTRFPRRRFSRRPADLMPILYPQEE